MNVVKINSWKSNLRKNNMRNIIELIENPTLRNHISELARKSISDLDWENSCSKMEKCISTYV